MQKHSSSEMPRQDKHEVMKAADDNIQGAHLLDAEKLPLREKAGEERAPEGEEGREEIRNKALRDTMGEIDAAPPKAVIFIGGITSPRAWSEDRSGTRRRPSARGYDKDFQQGLQKEDVFFVTHETVRGASGGFPNALVALKNAIKNHPNDKIVVDSNFLMQEFLYQPWKTEDAKEFDPFAVGKQTKTMLDRWMTDVQSGEPGATVSKSSLLEQRFQGSLRAMRNFSQESFLNGRELVFGLAADNPLALAFLVYAAREHLEPADLREALRQFHSSKTATGFFKIGKDRKISTSLQGRHFRPHRVH